MKKFSTVLFLISFTLAVKAQVQPPNLTVNVKSATQTFTEIQPYGKVDLEDLQMKQCDFEKDASAEVLQDVERISYDGNTELLRDATRQTITQGAKLKVERHRRIKIFTDYGRGAGNVRLTYENDGYGNPIGNLEAETINLVDGKIQITPFDKKGVYTEKIDRWRSALVFALPNVKPGSIIEFKYTSSQIPQAWYFQTNIPTRYTELETDYLGRLNARTVAHVKQPYQKNIGKTDDEKQIRAMVNVHSLPQEPYMTSEKDNWQRIELFDNEMLIHTWDGIGKELINFANFGGEFNQGVAGDGPIIKHAKSLKSNDEKIAFIFDTVKNAMKWDDITNFYTYQVTSQAWNKKTGNSAEINFILYNLLKKAGVNAFPMVISARDNGRMSPANPNLYAFNNMVVYVPVDTAKFYVMDATNKFGLFNAIPYDDLNSFGLSVNTDNGKTSMVPLEVDAPVIQSVFLNAEIKPEGKITGTAEITSDSYNKITAVKKYKTHGEKKYLDTLRNNDNNIKISSFKMENMDVDSLPLSQKIDFVADLTGSDENYIYF